MISTRGAQDAGHGLGKARFAANNPILGENCSARSKTVNRL